MWFDVQIVTTADLGDVAARWVSICPKAQPSQNNRIH